MTRTALTASLLYIALAVLYLSQSGAPVRVHMAMLTSLAIGYLFPAFAISSISAFVVRWKVVVLAAFAGAAAFGFLTSVVVVKAEFWDWWYVKYPIVAFGFAVLLFVHAAILSAWKAQRSAA